MSLNQQKIPVFVFPNQLKFYLLSKSTHKQVLTLYNPYDFPVKFKVCCTVRNKYSVIDPEGSIGPQMLVDIVIRHNSPIATNCNVTDKFRIYMQDYTTEQVLGKRDIDALLLEGEKENISLDGDFRDVPYIQKGTVDDQRMYFSNRTLPGNTFNNVIAVIVTIVCIVVLLLPSQKETPQPSSIPEYLHVSVNLKLVLAYVLGLVSMVIFRP